MEQAFTFLNVCPAAGAAGAQTGPRRTPPSAVGPGGVGRQFASNCLCSSEKIRSEQGDFAASRRVFSGRVSLLRCLALWVAFAAVLLAPAHARAWAGAARLVHSSGSNAGPGRGAGWALESVAVGAVSSNPVPGRALAGNLPNRAPAKKRAIDTGPVSPGVVCAGQILSVPFRTPAHFGAKNVFNFQLSDADGVFVANAPLLGTLVSLSATGGTLSGAVPPATPAGSGYRVRVVASKPAVVGTDNGADLTIGTVPVSQAAGPGTVAYGAPFDLTAAPLYPAPPARYVWTWNGPTPWGSSVPNPTFSDIVGPGVYRFTLTVTLGACDHTSFVDVTVLPSLLPRLTLAPVGSVLCPGTTYNLAFAVTGVPFPAGTVITAQLSTPSYGYATVIGSTTFGGLGSGTVPVLVPYINPRRNTYYRIQLLVSSPLDAASQTISLTDVPPLSPVVASSNSPVAAGDTLKLQATGSPNTLSFAWTFTPVGGTPRFFSSAQNPTVPDAQPAQSGRYHVRANQPFGCTDTASVQVLVVPADLEPPLAARGGSLQTATRLYPNPTAGPATLEITGLPGPGEVQVTLVNALGQVVFTRRARARAGALREPLDLSRLPAGVYAVHIATKQGTAVQRLLRQ